MSYETKYECGEQLDNFSQVSVGEKVIHKESGDLYEVAGLLWSNDAIAGNVLRFKNHLANYPIVQYCRAVPVKEQFEWVFENIGNVPFKDLQAEQMQLIVSAYTKENHVAEVLYDGQWEEKHLRRNFDGTLLPQNFFSESVYRVKREVVETPLDIPWEHVKEDFKYAAMDENGDVWVYEGLPVRGSEQWFGDVGIELKAINILTDGINWKNSLTKRPSKGVRPSTVGA